MIYADERIRTGDEVLVTNRDDILLAVGKATLSVLLESLELSVEQQQLLDEFIREYEVEGL